MLRGLDLLFSFFALLFLIPIFFLLIPVLRFTGEGEVFFLQERIGKNGLKFKVLKFATMLKDSPNLGAGTITEKNDLRILPLGQFLRKTKINELPQLFNILLGDMSVIGPRPHCARDLQGIPEEILKKVLKISPGLSGVGSVMFRDEEIILHNCDNGREFYDAIIAPYKGSLEVWYIENKSVSLYLKLILSTIRALCGTKPISLFRIFPTLPPLPLALQGYIK